MLGVKVDYEMSAWKKTLIAGLISYIDAGSIVAGLPDCRCGKAISV